MKSYILPIDPTRYEEAQSFGYYYLGIYPLSIKEACILKAFDISLYELTSDDTEHLLEDVDKINDDYLYGVALVKPFAEAYNKYYNKNLSNPDFTDILLKQSLEEFKAYIPKAVVIERGINYEDDFFY